jgi:AraC-like DNA-binding protein
LKEGAQSIYAVRKHSHEEISVGFVEKGSSRISCETLRFELNVNHAIFIPPDTTHLCQPDDINKFVFKMIYIDPLWFFSVFNLNVRSLLPQIAHLDNHYIEKKDRFLSSFIDLDDPFQAESEAVIFIGELLYDVFKIEKSRPPRIKKQTDVSIIKTYINENFTQEIRLDDLADLYGKSKFSLLRKFKAVYNLTPHAYVLNKRINKSKRLLQKGETVAQTAAMCGFFDQSHFIKSFRQYVGMNPIDYK